MALELIENRDLAVKKVIVQKNGKLGTLSLYGQW